MYDDDNEDGLPLNATRISKDGIETDNPAVEMAVAAAIGVAAFTALSKLFKD